MKKSIYACILAAFSILFCAAEAGAQTPPATLADVELCPAAKFSDADKSALDIKCASDAPTRIFTTATGLFEPNTEHTARLRYTLSPDDFSQLPHMKLRAVNSGGQILAERHLGASRGESFVKMPFPVPGGDVNVRVELVGIGKFSARISSLSISDGNGEKFLPIGGADTPKAAHPDNLPTGAAEFDIELPRPKAEKVVNAADFGLSESVENAATILNKAIEHCKKEGATKLLIPKGRYKMYENVTISLSGFEDFTLDGGGSVFVARKTATANLYVAGCTRTKIANLSFDYDWETEPLAAIVKITDIKKTDENTVIDVEFIDYDKYPLYGKKVRVADMENYDIKAKAVGQEGGITLGFGFSPNDKGPDTEWISPNKLRIKSHKGDTRPRLGRYYRLQHYYYGMGGIALSDNTHLTLENINIYSCKGHGILVSGRQKYFQFINVNIRPPAGDPKRVISCTADHLHFARSNGHFKMLNCEFSHGSDDCTNIHDLSAFGVKCGDKTIKLMAGTMPNVGDLVELRHGNYSATGYKSKVESISDKGKDARYINFADPLPNPEFDGFVLFNRTYDSSNVIIRDCRFHSNRARGLLILASNITIENCRFTHNQMGALKFETGYTFNVWSEGFGVDNVLVKDCVFDTVNPQGVRYQGKARDIFFGVYMRRDPSFEQTDYPVIRNILFANNRFKDSFGLIALISSANNIIFLDNTFENPTPRIDELPYRGAFYVNSASDIKILNNTWIKSPYVKNPGVFMDDDTAKGVLVQGNRLVDAKE